MSKTIGQFHYEVTKMAKDSRIPFDPFVHFCLKHCGGTAKNGLPTISAQLMTECEIDHHVQELKRDLDALGRLAKAALQRAHEETQRLVSERTSKQ